MEDSIKVSKLLILIILSGSLSAEVVNYKTHPEFTGEIKDYTNTNQLLGIDSDPQAMMSKAKNAARNFVKGLESSVFYFRSIGCGATLISSEGHAVTALHCLEQLTAGSKPLLKKQVIATLDSGQDITSNISIQEMEGHQYNAWDFDPIRFPKAKELLPVKIVALGKGYPDILKKWHPTHSEAIENAGLIKSFADDYAIIKLNKIPDRHKCVKVASAMPTPGSITWAAGYPANTRPHQTYLTEKTITDLINKANFFAPKELSPLFRRALRAIKELSDQSWYAFEGKQHLTPFFLSVGRAYQNYTQLRKEFSYPVFGRSDELLDMMTGQEKYLVSTSYIKPGFSGGGIFNTKGELIGVNSMSPNVLTMMRDKFQPLISHVRIDYIKNEVTRKLGVKASKEIFDCENPHIVK